MANDYGIDNEVTDYETRFKRTKISIKRLGLLKNKWCFVDGNGKESKKPAPGSSGKLITATHTNEEIKVFNHFKDANDLSGYTVEEAECLFMKMESLAMHTLNFDKQIMGKFSPEKLEQSLMEQLESTGNNGFAYMPEEEIAYVICYLYTSLTRGEESTKYYQKNKAIYDKFFKALAKKIKQTQQEADPEMKAYYEEPSKSAFLKQKSKEKGFRPYTKLKKPVFTQTNEQDAPQPQ